MYSSEWSKCAHGIVQKIFVAFLIGFLALQKSVEASDNGEVNTLTNEAGSFKSVDRDGARDDFPTTANPEGNTAQSTSQSFSTPPLDQINCQDQNTETPEESILRQEKETRDVEKGVVGLEIAQGAMEITLGAIRIAAAGTTADVIRREDNLASSRASLGNVVPIARRPAEILGPISADDAGGIRKQGICAGRSLLRPRNVLDDPFLKWNRGFSYRMKRSPSFADAFHSPLAPLASTSAFSPTLPPTTMSMPNLDEAERLLKLLENLLDTNNRVLRLLGIDLPPITSSGALLLRRYKERLYRRRHAKTRYAMQGYADEEDNWEEDRQNLLSRKTGPNDPHWLHSAVGQEEPIKAFSDELARLKRIRRVYQSVHRRTQRGDVLAS